MYFSAFETLESFEQFIFNNEIPSELVPAAVDRFMDLTLTPEAVSEKDQQSPTQDGRGKKRALKQDKENVPPRKKFRCTMCEKSFTRSYDLRRLEKSHQAVEKKFECSYCEKKFQHKFHKNRHEREVHNMDIKCDKCRMAFDNKRAFNKHVQTAHKKRKL
ncbi:Zinc finger protein 18 [Exaiptasia diaphana]|nr:Zinc finger protein 18 [Exaiptasia diaphana]